MGLIALLSPHFNFSFPKIRLSTASDVNCSLGVWMNFSSKEEYHKAQVFTAVTKIHRGMQKHEPFKYYNKMHIYLYEYLSAVFFTAKIFKWFFFVN